MSWKPCPEPLGKDKGNPNAIDLVIAPRTSDIGNLEVRRALPFRDKRMVGPFVFWDQMGPGEFLAGVGVDVRPHPHIGLSTVTYLFDGSMDHKDSLGSDRRIHPGDVNLMTAGGGIVHSERTGHDIREAPSSLFGIQSWLAQPKNLEDGAADFLHVGGAELPAFDSDGTRGVVILGGFQGLTSPVPLQWDTLYVDISMTDGAKLDIPSDTEERALFGVKGSIEIDGQRYEAGQMLVLATGKPVTLRAHGDTRVMLLGGAVMDGPRYIWWNFVSSRRDQIIDAAERWQAGEFPEVPGDRDEFIPLPPMPRLADYP